MRFIWPNVLWLLALIPLVLLVIYWMARRRKRYAVRYSSLSLVRAAVAKSSRWRRYLPLALFLLALAGLVGALARPVTVTYLPAAETTIILALDVSRSMRAIDIAPSRMEAAKRAALSFVRNQKPGTSIGIVAFSGFAELVQSPTTDQEALETAIMSLTFGRRTAVGNGILRAVEAIAEVDETVAPLVESGEGRFQPVAPGAYAPAIVVLLTDGASNSGIQPADAAQLAAERGIRVYTIGFGTDNPQMPADGLFPGSPSINGGGGDPQWGGQGGGMRFRLAIDEETLMAVADLTGGEYHYATSASELQEVFDNLPTHLITRSEVSEISVLFAAAAALLAVLAIALSIWWQPMM